VFGCGANTSITTALGPQAVEHFLKKVGPFASAELVNTPEQKKGPDLRRGLANVSLHDEEAGKDVQELRSLLETWRDTKRTVTQTIARIITSAILFALAAGAWMHFANRNN
jgi:hypothetical protein